MKFHHRYRLAGCLMSFFTLGTMYMYLLEGWFAKRTSRPAQTKVFLLRIPKTGTSTTTFMFWRLAINRNLTVLLPKPTMEWTVDTINPKGFELSANPFDICANQLIYNPGNFYNFLPPNVTYVALLREPFDHLTSVLNYKPHEYSKIIPKGDLVEVYLTDPRGYEAKFHHFVSLTDNPFARFLGLSKKLFHSFDSMESFISKIDNEFKVVLILEQYDESLIMMKRELYWTFKDIIYAVENANPNKPKNKKPDLLSKHRVWSSVDYQIYSHFKQKLNIYIRNGGQDLKKEVNEFKTMLTQVHAFCNQSLKDTSVLTFAGSDYSEEFSYTAKDCEMLIFSGVQLRNLIRKRQGTTLETIESI